MRQCMLSAVGHHSYYRFQQKMMKARASWHRKWGSGGHSLAASLWPCCFFYLCLYLLGSRVHFITAALHTLNYSWSTHCTDVYLCTHAGYNRIICWQKRCLVQTNIEHCCWFVVAQGCILVAHGKFFCRIFLVAVHERFSGHSVCTMLRRRIQSVQSSACIFNYMYFGFWLLIFCAVTKH